MNARRPFHLSLLSCGLLAASCGWESAQNRGAEEAIPAAAGEVAAAPADPNLADPTLAVVDRVRPAVVTVESFGPSGARAGQGSGFFVAPDRVAVARHSIARAARVRLKLEDQRAVEALGVAAEDPAADLALLAVTPLDPAPPALRPAAAAAREGQRVLIIGTPMGLDLSVGDGIVSAIRELPELGRVIQTTAPISPGSSGSPLVNLQGEVVGIARAQIAAGQGLNFATPGERLQALLEEDRQRREDGAAAGIAPFARKTQADDDPATSLPATLEGREALQAGDAERALERFRAAATELPDSAVAWFHVGAALVNLQRLEEALEPLQRSLQLDPTRLQTRFSYGSLLAALGRYEEALDIWRPIAATDPDFPELRKSIGSMLYRLQRWPEVAAAYQELAALHPEVAEFHNRLGIARMKSGDAFGAIEALAEANDLKPGDPEIMNNLGHAFRLAHAPEPAILILEQAVKLRPDSPLALWGLGAARRDAGQIGEAIPFLEKAVALDPSLADAYYDLGVTYFMAGRPEDARGIAERLKSLDAKRAADLEAVLDER